MTTESSTPDELPAAVARSEGVDVFGDYRLIQPLRAARATDEVAVMWRAERHRDGSPVAIKIFDVAQAGAAQREAEIAGVIAHPHVLAPQEVVDGGQRLGLVYPWCHGGSLADLLATRRRIEWPEALTVLIPIADALAAAHERGFVHGDLSATNVLFDRVGRPLLGDFGASRACAESGLPVMVTPTDVAPEVVRGAVPSASADLFSLGSIALGCIAGQPAWNADCLRDVLIQSAAGQWPELDPAMAPPALVALVRRLLDPEPEQRGSAAALAIDLRHVGTPVPVTLLGESSGAAAATVRAATMVRPDAVRPPAARGMTPPPSRFAGIGPAVLGMGAALRKAGAAAWSTGIRVGRRGVVSVRRMPRRAVLAAAVIVLAGAGALAYVTSAAPAQQASAAGVVGAEGRWLTVVRDLDAARARAIVQRDAALLTAVYVAGSAPAEQDAARIASLKAAGLRVSDGAHTVTAVRLLESGADGSATVEVTSWQHSYTVLDDVGDPVDDAPPAEPVTVQMRLASTADGLRIRSIRGS